MQEYLNVEIDEQDEADGYLPLNEEAQPPTAVIRIGGKPVCTYGNISVLAGQPKCGKTTVTAQIVGQALRHSHAAGRSTPCISSDAPDIRVLWIDTEMSREHALRMQRIIAEESGLPDFDVTRFVRFFTLREKTPNERIEVLLRQLKKSCERNQPPDLVLVDGITDLMLDPNSLEESSNIVEILSRASTQYLTAISVIIHENSKGEKQLRGHIGSQLARKAESVVKVEMVDGNRKISPVYTRNEEFPALLFSTSEDGETNISLFEEVSAGKDKPLEFNVELLKGIARLAFKAKEAYSSKSKFNIACQTAYYECTGKRIGTSKTYLLLDAMENANIIEQVAINNRKTEIRAKSEFTLL